MGGIHRLRYAALCLVSSTKYPLPGSDASRVDALDTDRESQLIQQLERRFGVDFVAERLARERAHEIHAHRPGARFFYVETWYSAHSVIRNSLRLVGLHGRARRNVRALQVRRNDIRLAGLPAAFDGYTLLQVSDPHVDLGPDIPQTLIECVSRLQYDLCVLTGDYRTRTFGPYQPTLAAMERIRPHLKGPVYAVLGNHDTLRLVPGLETLGIRVLMNESIAIARKEAAIYLAGIDDAHAYRQHDIAKTRAAIPDNAISILLSHTPEAYAEAATAGFDVMLSGHTHGGQICLPGGFPLITDADCPRRYAKGAWRHENLIGYTSAGSGASIVDVRLNCPPEVTLHRLTPADHL